MKVIDLYEEAKLKDQKLNLSSLLSKPEFKQQYLAPIRALEENDQCLLLQKVINKEISLAQLKTESSNIKQLHALRIGFTRLTNASSWDDAKKNYPEFATDKQMLKFIHLDLKKAIPKSFSDFCLRAKNSADAPAQLQSCTFSTSFKAVSAHILQDKFTEVSGTKIKSQVNSFTGANLAIASFEEVCILVLKALCHNIIRVFLASRSTSAPAACTVVLANENNFTKVQKSQLISFYAVYSYSLHFSLYLPS